MIFDKIENRFRQWNERFKSFLQKLCPPGYELTKEYRIFWCWFTIGILYSMQFFINYMNAYDSLFYYSGSTRTRVLKLDMRMPGYLELVEDAFDVLLFGSVFLIFVFAMHYDYYRRGSKPIYLMRRLDDQRLLRKTYLGTLCIYGLIFLITGVTLLILYYMVYRFMTPQMCLML